MKVAKPYPYLYADVDRQGVLAAEGAAPLHGHHQGRVRIAGVRCQLRHRGRACEKKIIGKHGTIGALARSYLRSAAFAQLAPTTQKARRYLIDRFGIKYDTLPVAGPKRAHVKLMMDGLAATPGAARNVLSMIRVLIALAIEDGIREDDPTIGIKRPRLSKEGWHAWTEDEVLQYEAKHPIGSQARLSFALAIYTSRRSADLIRMGRQHVRDGRISVRQQKTGTLLAIRLDPKLKEILDLAPSEHLTFLVSQLGKPYKSAGSFGQRMKLWAREAGLAGCPLHGLRKVCLRRLAEVGCTAPEIMAISGHKSLAEVERYIKSAEQKVTGDRAIERTLTYPRIEPAYPREKKA